MAARVSTRKPLVKSISLSPEVGRTNNQANLRKDDPLTGQAPTTTTGLLISIGSIILTRSLRLCCPSESIVTTAWQTCRAAFQRPA